MQAVEAESVGVAGNRIHVKRRWRVVFRKQMHAMVRTNIHLCSSLDVSSSSSSNRKLIARCTCYLVSTPAGWMNACGPVGTLVLANICH